MNKKMKSIHEDIERFAKESKQEQRLGPDGKPVGKSKIEIEEIISASGKSLFGSYKSLAAKRDITLSPQICDSIYRKTEMFRIINKIVGDVLKDGFKVETGNDSADELCKYIRRIWTLTEVRDSIIDYYKYGNSFDFIEWAADEKNIIDIRGLPLESMKPKWQQDTLLGYEFGNKNIFLEEPIDVLHLKFAPDKGSRFGSSLLQPAASILEILFNIDIDTAILIDHYASPIIHWMLDSGVEVEGRKQKVTPKQIEGFLDTLVKQKTGEDLATDISVTAEILGAEGKIWDFSSIADYLNQKFHAICGVPATLLGFKGDNQNVSKQQLRTYYDTIAQERLFIGEQLIERLYRPFLMANGYVDLDIEIKWPTLEVEEKSEKIKWVSQMSADFKITTSEYRREMGFPEKMPEDEVMIPQSAVQAELGQTYGIGLQQPGTTAKWAAKNQMGAQQKEKGAESTAQPQKSPQK